MEDIQSEKRVQSTNDNGSGDDLGKVIAMDDQAVEQFYGSSTSEAYRLKSELIGKCMEEIGMGR